MMRLMVQSRIGAIVFTAAVLLSGCAGGRENAGFEARVYEVQLQSGQGGKLDVANLNARMARGEDLGKILTETGATRLIYRMCQPMGYNCDSNITLGTRMPVITNTRVSASGSRMNTELSDMTESGVEIAKGIQAPTILKAEFAYAGNLDVGRPLVGVCFDASSGGKDGNAVAYIYRIVLSNLR